LLPLINRANAQTKVFHEDGDYRAFVELIGLARQRVPMRVFAYCVMPNHLHLAKYGLVLGLFDREQYPLSHPRRG
jgi:hypothetical protein